jgi:heme exporter protein D
MDLGPYAPFIVTAYAAAIVIVVGLVGWLALDRRHLVRQLQGLDAQGVSRRRSEHKVEEQR